MTDTFIEYIDRKISEETAKRDAVRLEPTDCARNPNQYFHDLRIWWCHEARRQAYEDSLIQYKLTRR